MLPFVRLWLPIVICLAAVVLMIVRGFDETSLEGGGALLGAGLSVALLNVFFRMGVEGDRLRDQEDEARAFFAANGRWPDDPEPAAREGDVEPTHQPPHGTHRGRRLERPPRRPR